MDAKTHAQYETRVRMIKAMAHPTRLFIVDELARHGEHCVWDLKKMVGGAMPTMSRHLAILRDAGLIDQEKRGQQVYYRIRLDGILNFRECVETLVRSNVTHQRELLTT